jgi:hypothetical protein
MVYGGGWRVYTLSCLYGQDKGAAAGGIQMRGELKIVSWHNRTDEKESSEERCNCHSPVIKTFQQVKIIVLITV